MGNWEAEVRESGANDDVADAEHLITFLRDGTSDHLAGLSRYSPQYVPSTHELLGELHRRCRSALKRAIEVAPAMPDDVFERLGEVVALRHPVSADDWLRSLLGSSFSSPTVSLLRLEHVEAIGVRVGFDAGDMAARQFGPAAHRWARMNRSSAPDLTDWVSDHVEVVRPFVAEPRPESIDAWEQLRHVDAATLACFAPELARAATASAKTVRAAAAPSAEALGFAALRPHLEALATGGDPGTRARAISELRTNVPSDEVPALLDWLVDACSADRAKGVQAEIEATRSIVAGDGSGAGDEALGPVPALPSLDWSPPDEALVADLVAWTHADGRRVEHARILINALTTTSSGTPYAHHHLVWAARLHPEVVDRLTHAQVARVALSLNPGWMRGEVKELVALCGYPTPLEIDAVADHENIDPSRAISVILNGLVGPDDVWAAEDVAAWARRNLALLTRLVTEPETAPDADRDGVFRAIAHLPARPRSLDEALIVCGTSGHLADRPRARRVLGPDVAASVTPLLRASKVGDRSAAGEWLRELADPTAEAALRDAIAKEKQDAAKVQMIGALEAIGASLDEYLSPEALLTDARSALAKRNAVPATLDWLSVEALPTVRWNDGSAVNSDIWQWFLATAVRAKTAEPSALLRLHVSRMDRSDAEKLGQALFESWLAQDLRPRPREECEQIARQQATPTVNWANDPRNTSNYYDQYKGKTVEQVMAQLLPALLAEPAGSAVESKGVLAVVAATGGPELASQVHAFVKKWRGHRLAQGKAMMQMLAWMDHPQAIQVVLTIGQRFRPKGIQEEAHRQTELLAERRGWTIDDLADRTVPRGGFDDDGRLEIDYGTRTFTAHLRDDLSIELSSDETGKVIKSLPGPRADEDEGEIKAIQKDLAAVKREIKSTAALQPERLQAAMFVQRAWAGEDFTRYVVGHPVMRRLAQRLVWIATTDDTSVAFRPTSDGALLLIDDDELELPSKATVTLAHDEVVDDDAAARWLEHLADYGVKPLFPQFDRPPAPSDETPVIRDFEGHLIGSLALRGQLDKLGWQLAPAGDGGWISEIFRDFRVADLRAVVSFTGMPAYREDLTTALQALYFTSPSSSWYETSARPLSAVPRIMLREIYAEVAAIAAAGSGFDPEWKTKASP